MARPSNAEVPEPLHDGDAVSARAGTVLDTGEGPPSSAELVDPLVGTVVSDRYRIDALLGAGGMGCVYRATHVHMRNVVALKVLHRQMNLIPEAVARFEREAVAAARIQHPNVAAARDFGRLKDGSFYMALEFIEGTGLRDLMHEMGALSVPRTVNIIRQIAEALNAAHAEGVVHRDLKPENVMLADKGQDLVKVLDFGIAKVSEGRKDEHQLTQLGSVFGTPDYMSPEQAAGKPVDHRSDLYALGVLMYEMLTGEPPFTGDAIAIVLSKHMHEPPPDLPPHIDWRLVDLTNRLLAKDPADRPASARQVADELVRTRLSVVPVPPRSRKWLVRLDKVKRVANNTHAALAPVLRPVGRATLAVGRRGRHVLAKMCDRLTTRFPRLAILDAEFAVGGHRASWWSLLGYAALLIFTGAVLWVWSSGVRADESATPGPATEGANTSLAEATQKDATPRNEARSDELRDLLEVPVYKRKMKDWLSIGQLLKKGGEWSESTAAYRNAIQLDPNVAKDPTVLQAFRDLAEELESHAAAINVAVNLLGEPGLDLVYDLWLETKEQRPKRQITEAAYKKLEILRLRRASAALRVRLDLEFLGTGDCAAIAKTVQAAARYADQRSVDSLTQLKSTRGCGASKSRDCYPCLRGDDTLELAITRARQTPAPRFDGDKYVAGGG